MGEYQFVADEATRQIEHIRTNRGNFDAGLADPYLLLGEAQMGLGEPENAAESFTMALHVTRMSEGLNSTGQIVALYRVSDALVELGDYQQANEAQERAYAIMRNHLGVANPQLLPSMLHLIKWYESNRRYRAAKILYIDAMRLASQVIPSHDVRRVELARAYAQGMQNTVFPPMHAVTRFRAFDIEVPGYEALPGTRPPSSYSLGRRALEDVVNFVKTHAPDDPEMIATAKLNLADWHQLFGKESQATRMYRTIWHELDSITEVRARMFDRPKLLYIRLPQISEKTSDTSTGVVELLLTVSYRGTVTGRISQIVEPPNNRIEFRARVAAREARFRPAMRDGKTVTTHDFLLTHRYPLMQ